MEILLININPVVSRLLTLCTRDEHIKLDEVESAGAVKKTSYDIVFVDETSYVDDVKALLEELEVRQKVFISYSSEAMTGFDQTIKKPFLPSQIINVIENVDVRDSGENLEEITIEKSISIFPLSSDDESVEEEVLPDIFPLPTEEEEVDEIFELEENAGTEILNSDEIEKIKALLDMDDEIAENEDDGLLSDDEYEARKVKVIKEQLIADGLEIVEENEIVEELSITALDTFEEIDKQLDKKKKSKKKNKKKETAFNEDELSRIEDAVIVALDKMKPKKIKKLLKGKKIEVKIKLEDDQ